MSENRPLRNSSLPRFDAYFFGIVVFVLFLLFGDTIIVLGVSKTPLAAATANPSILQPTPTIGLTLTATTTAPISSPTGSFLQDQGLGIVVGALVTILAGAVGWLLNYLLSPIIQQWGRRLKNWFEGSEQKYYETYLKALARQHSELKLIGISGREGMPRPRLVEGYIPLNLKSLGDETSPQIRILTALKSARHLVVLGDPGSGKSTLLDWLVETSCTRLASKHPSKDRPLPIYVPLRACAEEKGSILAILANPAWRPTEQVSPPNFFDKYLEKGFGLILLDGLDEVVDEGHRDTVADKIEQLARSYPENSFVIACRRAGWNDSLLNDNFRRLVIVDLDPTGIRQFVNAWYREVLTLPVRWRPDLSSTARKKLLSNIETEAKAEANKLAAALLHNPRLSELAGNPMLLSLIALVHLRYRELPQGRSELFRRCLDVLLEQWDVVDKKLKLSEPTRSQKDSILEQLAFLMQYEQVVEVPADTIIKLITHLPGLTLAPVEILRQLEERSGILVASAIDRYKFAHRSLQEYLAAKAIYSSPALEETLRAHLTEEPWKEVLLLYAGLRREVDNLLNEIIETGSAATDLSIERNLLILVSECLGEDILVEPELRNRVIGRLERAVIDTNNHSDYYRLSQQLALVGGTGSLDLLRAAVDDNSRDSNLRAIAFEAFATLSMRLGATENLDSQVLFKMESPESALRRAAARIVGQLGIVQDNVLSALRKLLPGSLTNTNLPGDPDVTVRDAAFRSLLQLDEEGLIVDFAGTSHQDNTTNVTRAGDLMVAAVSEAIVELAVRKISALVVICQVDDLARYIETGVQVDWPVSAEVLSMIFRSASRVAAGAVIIRADRIVSMGCDTPLEPYTETVLETIQLHALGITNESDVVAVLVGNSGDISVAYNGRMITRLNADRLRHILEAFRQRLTFWTIFWRRFQFRLGWWRSRQIHF